MPIAASVPISVVHQVSIRDAGLDEYWLQQQILDNPACLGLGDLEVLARERQQASGGRLDILLKDPEDDTMYEVEVMLGETDETHIIRTIEYWDNEKRRWPLRQHFAVLVAERINRRFFNVIHLLSHSIPIIAIQASLLDMRQTKSLLFTTILDTFEEADDGTSLEDRTYDREYWTTKASWTVDAAEALMALSRTVFGEPTLNFVKNYVAITVGGNNYMRLRKRSQGKALLSFRVIQNLQDEVASLLDANSITYVRKPSQFRITVDRAMIEKNANVFKAIAEHVKKYWGKDS